MTKGWVAPSAWEEKGSQGGLPPPPLPLDGIPCPGHLSKRKLNLLQGSTCSPACPVLFLQSPRFEASCSSPVASQKPWLRVEMSPLPNPSPLAVSRQSQLESYLLAPVQAPGTPRPAGALGWDQKAQMPGIPTWLPGRTDTMRLPLRSLKNVIYWGTPPAAFFTQLCHTLITLPAFLLYKHICVYNYIYIYIFLPDLGFVPAQTLASLSTVCV